MFLYLASINSQWLRGILQLQGEGGGWGGDKATGTGRRMATFVSYRVETVNDEVKGDSQVQSLAPPAGFA